jgi:hypothetical protein
MTSAPKTPELNARELAVIASLEKAKAAVDEYTDELSCVFQCLELEIGSTVLLNSKAFAREQRIDDLSKLIPILIETIRDKADYPPHPRLH